MKSIFKYLFILFEKLVVKLNNWHHIPDSSMKMLYITPRIYKGKNIVLNDGTSIKKGDLVGEIHVDNLKVNTIDNDLKTIFSVLENEFIALAYAAEHDNRYKLIKAFYGRTVLYPLIRRYGFTIVDMENSVSSYIIGFWENTLRKVFGNNIRKNNKNHRVPKECWISKRDILLKHKKKSG